MATLDKIDPAVFAKKIEMAKLRARCRKKCHRVESIKGAETPETITLTRKNGQWVANGRKVCAIEDSPESAMHALLIKLKLRSPTPEEQHALERFYPNRRITRCEVRDLASKTGLDGDTHYSVSFSCNARLNRGDFERLVCNGLHREDLDVRGEPLDDLSGDGERQVA